MKWNAGSWGWQPTAMNSCWQDDDRGQARHGKGTVHVWLSARLRECQAHHLSSNYTNNGETQLSFASVQKLWAHENVQCAYRRIPPLPPAWPQGLCDILWERRCLAWEPHLVLGRHITKGSLVDLSYLDTHLHAYRPRGRRERPLANHSNGPHIVSHMITNSNLYYMLCL